MDRLKLDNIGISEGQWEEKRVISGQETTELRTC